MGSQVPLAVHCLPIFANLLAHQQVREDSDMYVCMYLYTYLRTYKQWYIYAHTNHNILANNEPPFKSLCAARRGKNLLFGRRGAPSEAGAPEPRSAGAPCGREAAGGPCAEGREGRRQSRGRAAPKKKGFFTARCAQRRALQGDEIGFPQKTGSYLERCARIAFRQAIQSCAAGH